MYNILFKAHKSNKSWQKFLPMSRLFCDHNPFATTIVTSNSFRSPLEFHRDNNPRRREEVDDGSEGGRQGTEGNEVAAVRPLAWCSVEEDDRSGEAGLDGERAGSGELF